MWLSGGQFPSLTVASSLKDLPRFPVLSELKSEKGGNWQLLLLISLIFCSIHAFSHSPTEELCCVCHFARCTERVFKCQQKCCRHRFLVPLLFSPKCGYHFILKSSMLEVGLSFGVLPQMLVPLMELTSPSELILVLIHTLYSVSEYTSFEWTSFLSHIFDSFPVSDALRVQSTAMDLSSHWVEGTIVIGEMLGRQILTIGELMIFFSWFLAVNVWLFSGEGPACTFWVFLRKYLVQLDDSSLRVAWTTGS